MIKIKRIIALILMTVMTGSHFSAPILSTDYTSKETEASAEARTEEEVSSQAETEEASPQQPEKDDSGRRDAVTRNTPDSRLPSGDKSYVKNCGRPGDADLTYFKYYDKDGNYIHGGLDTHLYVNGTDRQTNVICIREDYSPGNEGYVFDVDEHAVSDASFRNLAYYAVTMLSYNDAHNLLCYYAANYGSDISGYDLKTGNSKAKNWGSENITADGFNGTYSQFVTKYTAKAIPEDIVFELIYLAHDTTYESPSYGAFQDFLAWKVTVKQDYYAVIRKTDQNGRLLNGITFRMKVNGTEVKYDNYSSCIYSGYYFDYTKALKGGSPYIWIGNETRDNKDGAANYTALVTGNNGGKYGDGLAVIYLGKYETAPSVEISEAWTASTTASDRAYWKDKIEAVKYSGTERLVENIPIDKKYFSGSTTAYVTASTYSSALNAVKAADGNSYENTVTYPYYIAIKKVDRDGKALNGVSFSISYYDNDAKKNVSIKGQYSGGKYQGIWTGFMNDKDCTVPMDYRNTGNEGVGVFFLGCFKNEPSEIKVTENWQGRTDAGCGWEGGRAELVTAVSPRTVKNVYAKQYAPDTSAHNIKAYCSEKDAISHISSATYKNYHFANATMIKESDNKLCSDNNPAYSFDGISYGLYGDSACTELIAVVKLSSDSAGTKGIIKSAADITLKKDITDNGSEIYKTTINGVHGIGGLMYGSYWWKEISTGTSGYLLDPEPHKITLSAEYSEDFHVFTDKDALEKGKIRVNKLLSGSGSEGISPAGATYEIKGIGSLDWYSGTFTIGADGYSPYKELAYGTYIIKEKTVPSAAPVNGEWSIDTTAYTVTLSKDGGTKTISGAAAVTAKDATVQSTDKAYQYYYVAVKKVDDTGKTMNGVTFDLTVNGTTRTKALKTGKYINGSNVSDAAAGVAIYYLGKYDKAPTVTIKENWTDKGYVQNTAGRSTAGTTAETRLTLYNTKAKAESNAGTFVYINVSRKYLYLTKRSSDTVYSEGNPNYSLAGAEYKLYKSENEANTALVSGNYGTALATFKVKADGTSTVNDTTAVKLDVSDWMNKDSSTGVFKNTVFYLIETKAGKNYKRSTEVKAVTITPANTIDAPAKAEMVDEPAAVPFGLKIVKSDMISGGSNTPEGKSLDGAVFRADFYAADIEAVLAASEGDVAGYLAANYSPDERYSNTFTIKKGTDGSYSTEVKPPVGEAYPIGFIVITETAAPEDYQLADAKYYISGGAEDIDITGNTVFVIYREFVNDQAAYGPRIYHPGNASTLSELTEGSGVKHGIDVTATEENTYYINIENKPVRGDVSFTKVKYADETALEGVEFVIRNNETGEEHSVFTDENGYATTINNKDAWFSRGTETEYPYAEGYGALPTGYYTLEEKRCEANKDYQLLAPMSFQVTTDENIIIASSDNKLYNIGLPYINTTAYEKETETKELPIGDDGTIIDDIVYFHLKADSTFYIVGTLMVRYPDGSYEAYMKDGSPYKIVSEAINTPDNWTRSEYEFDGSYRMEFTGVDTNGYENCRFVVFQKLYYDAVPEDDSMAAQYPEYQGTEEKVFPILHENIDNEDETLYLPRTQVNPGIETKARDKKTGGHVGKAEDRITIVDAVSYYDVVEGEGYTVKGKLMDSETGKEFLVDDKPVTAEKSFVADKSEGTVELEFSFDGSMLQGATIVVFEELFHEGSCIYSHADISNRDQTVSYPYVETHVEEDTKVVQNTDNVTVVDDVKYKELAKDETYMIEGYLMDSSTGENIVVDGIPVKTTKTFKAEEEDGLVEMKFVFDASQLEGDVTVFEYVYQVKDDEKKPTYTLVVEHSDINNKDQTFKVVVPEQPKEPNKEPKTGDSIPIYLLYGVLLISGIGLIAVFLKKRAYVRK